MRLFMHPIEIARIVLRRLYIRILEVQYSCIVQGSYDGTVLSGNRGLSASSESLPPF